MPILLFLFPSGRQFLAVPRPHLPSNCSILCFPPQLHALMGCFFSSSSVSLLEFDSGIMAAEVVVQTERDFALCNSDKIFFDSYPQAAPPGDELEPGQIYFLLPATELSGIGFVKVKEFSAVEEVDDEVCVNLLLDSH